MARDVISTCPVCEGELTISRLHCRSCGTALEGEFGVGRELGISYPTVRGRVDALVRALGLAEGDEDEGEDELEEVAPVTEAPEAPDADLAAERRAILERLSRREIAADEAAAALRELGGS